MSTPGAVITKTDDSGFRVLEPDAVSNALKAETGALVMVDPTDNTKVVDLDASALTTATTRTVTMPDADVDLTLVNTLNPGEIADPGNAGAIPVTGSGVCPLVTGGAETRTVADPTRVGLRLTLFFLTDGGDCVVTFASPINVAGNTIGTFADATDYLDLFSVRDGAASFAWKVGANDGVALS